MTAMEVTKAVLWIRRVGVGDRCRLRWTECGWGAGPEASD